MSCRWVSSRCLSTSERERPRLCSVISTLKASIPPYSAEYLGGLPPLLMIGRCFSASSSHHVTCAIMSLTDQMPVTPDTVICESDKPAYDSLNSVHLLSSCFKSCCLSMFQLLLSTTNKNRSTPMNAKSSALTRIVENDAKRVSVSRPDTAHAVSQIHTVH